MVDLVNLSFDLLPFGIEFDFGSGEGCGCEFIEYSVEGGEFITDEVMGFGSHHLDGINPHVGDDFLIGGLDG